MTDLELIFSMLGEASTKEIVKTQGSKGFNENKKAAKEGGNIAGKARKDLEKNTRQKIVTSDSPLKSLPTKVNNDEENRKSPTS